MVLADQMQNTSTTRVSDDLLAVAGSSSILLQLLIECTRGRW
eukprot:SAG22_NODE_19823_length_271_cov_0.604651_2_plen_41_part_01